MGVLNSFCPGGWGIRPSKKLPRGFARGGGWSGLELTDTLAYDELHQLGSVFDFKYYSVRLKLMHSVGHHQAVQNSSPTPVLCQTVSFPLVCKGRLLFA